MTFYTNFASAISETEIATNGGLSYLYQSTASRLAGLPTVDTADFSGLPYLPALGGALVAAETPVPGTTLVQRMWLPVMDSDKGHAPLQLPAVDGEGKTNFTELDKFLRADGVRVLANNIPRAAVKLIACVYGVGLSLYMGYDGDGPGAAKVLGITPETDLRTAEPLVATLKESGHMYIEWSAALAAARITDPSFHWEVVMWDGKPYRVVLGCVWVDVATTYRGRTLRMSLPVADAAFKTLPVAKVSVLDWNKTAMRALAKCIAFNTGYGLSVYEDAAGLTAMRKKDDKASVEKAAPQPAPQPAPTPAPTPAPASSEAQAPSATAQAEAKVPESDAASRFKEVMRVRRQKNGAQGLIGLYDAIAISTKFQEAEKPTCYRLLTTGIAALSEELKVNEVEVLLNSLLTHKGISYLAEDTRELVCAKILRMALNAVLASEGDDSLVPICALLGQAGIIRSEEDFVRKAKMVDVPEETIDWACSCLEVAAFD